LNISRWNTEFLYISSLPAGLGSNDIGLDRGQLGHTRIVRFERVGHKVLLIQSNYAFRATSDNAAERRAGEGRICGIGHRRIHGGGRRR